MKSVAGIAGLDCILAWLGEAGRNSRNAIHCCAGSKIGRPVIEGYEFAVWNGRGRKNRSRERDRLVD